MTEPSRIERGAAPGDFLAAERTFLAWIRTGLALMGFGFVVARFGLFLRELQITANVPAPQSSSGLSLAFGTVLIAMGVVAILLALWRHLRMVRELNAGAGDTWRRPSFTAVTIAVLLAAGGVALTLYLLLAHGLEFK
jgi:inner membrane protein YidH